MGMALFRDEKDLLNLIHTSNYIIRRDSVDSGRFTIEGSRPFSSLKPWATFKILGASGVKLLFEHAFDLAANYRGLVERHCNFEPMNQPELFIFNYRFVPKKIQRWRTPRQRMCMGWVRWAGFRKCLNCPTAG